MSQPPHTAVERRADLAILARVAPELWPQGRRDLRLRVVAAMGLLVLAKVATVLTPIAFGAAVDGIAAGSGSPDSAAAALAWAPLALVAAYCTTRLLSTAMQQLRDMIFARVGQHALRQLALKVFAHIHRLSLGYHLGRRTGELSLVTDRGIKAIDFLLRYLVFSIVPLMVELCVVIAIFLAAYGWGFAGALAGTVLGYAVFTLKVTEWRLKIRQRMNDEDQEAHQRAVDSLMNYETVKYFNAELREIDRYDRAMAGYQAAAEKTAISLGLLNMGQAVIIGGGLFSVMGLAAMGVESGTLSVGAFVAVNAFMIQITVPLNFLGTTYREIRQALIDMRAMYALLDADQMLHDRPGAPALRVTAGRVAFRGVRFGYGPERSVLQEVDFEVPGGRTMAIVGPSGAGKSTIARLLFRFYDPTAGRVEIDGQDLATVTQASIRAAIGVVPQDTVLFNDTIAYNIAYGTGGATRAAVEAAARAARIHDFIAALPAGYDTLVGERGLKLSGGEKQRVAIARTVLKNPPILILDEATSALDTQTERAIQGALGRLGEGRTVITIAHRLSTVVDADEIVVLEDGRVAERGRHEALLALGGRYSAMWARQEAERAV
ncbi:MAG: ABC transporter ATP-binding protein/permease [Pseudomonadota bacterium]